MFKHLENGNGDFDFSNTIIAHRGNPFRAMHTPDESNQEVGTGDMNHAMELGRRSDADLYEQTGRIGGEAGDYEVIVNPATHAFMPGTAARSIENLMKRPGWVPECLQISFSKEAGVTSFDDIWVINDEGKKVLDLGILDLAERGLATITIKEGYFRTLKECLLSTSSVKAHALPDAMAARADFTSTIIDRFVGEDDDSGEIERRLGGMSVRHTEEDAENLLRRVTNGEGKVSMEELKKFYAEEDSTSGEGVGAFTDTFEQQMDAEAKESFQGAMAELYETPVEDWSKDDHEWLENLKDGQTNFNAIKINLQSFTDEETFELVESLVAKGDASVRYGVNVLANLVEPFPDMLPYGMNAEHTQYLAREPRADKTLEGMASEYLNFNSLTSFGAALLSRTVQMLAYTSEKQVWEGFHITRNFPTYSVEEYFPNMPSFLLQWANSLTEEKFKERAGKAVDEICKLEDEGDESLATTYRRGLAVLVKDYAVANAVRQICQAMAKEGFNESVLDLIFNGQTLTNSGKIDAIKRRPEETWSKKDAALVAFADSIKKFDHADWWQVTNSHKPGMNDYIMASEITIRGSEGNSIKLRINPTPAEMDQAYGIANAPLDEAIQSLFYVNGKQVVTYDGYNLEWVGKDEDIMAFCAPVDLTIDGKRKVARNVATAITMLIYNRIEELKGEGAATIAIETLRIRWYAFRNRVRALVDKLVQGYSLKNPCTVVVGNNGEVKKVDFNRVMLTGKFTIGDKTFEKEEFLSKVVFKKRDESFEDAFEGIKKLIDAGSFVSQEDFKESVGATHFQSWINANVSELNKKFALMRANAEQQASLMAAAA